MSSDSSPSNSGSHPGSGTGDSQLDNDAFGFYLSPDDDIQLNVSQVKETQFVEMEIDTQAMKSNDRRGLVAAHKVAAQKRFSVPENKDDLPPAFTFTKAQKKTLAIGIPRMAGAPAKEPAKQSAVEKSAVGE